MTRPCRSLLGACFATLALVGCSSGGGPAAVSGALTSGRVTSEGGASSAVSVRAYGRGSDGTLTPASDAVTTSADGHYTLHVTLADSATALVVRVEDGTARMTALGRTAVDADVTGGGSITLAPIDARSTFVADVTANVEASEDVSLAESSSVSLFLSPDAAARLSASTDHAAAVADAADALSSARATFVQALDASASGSGNAQVALSGTAEAEAQLASRLDAAFTDADVHTAYATYLDAVITSTTSAGFSLETVAAASIAATSALDASLDQRVSSGHAELHELATFAVTSAVDAGIGASLGSSAITSASTELRTNVLSMASAGGSAEASASAWASYAATIETELTAHASVDQTLLASLNGEIDSAINTLDVTWTQIGPSASASERVQAFLTFRANVDSTANVATLTSAGVSEATAHAALDAMAEVRAVAVVH